MHQVGTEAIQCTEGFEFVRRLADPTFAMPTLQPYRLLHCLRLAAGGPGGGGPGGALGEWLAEGGAVEQDPVPAWPRHLHTLVTSLKYLKSVYQPFPKGTREQYKDSKLVGIPTFSKRDLGAI